MFATTQPEDIPQTIRSRCQHFSFHAVKLDDIVGQLRFIATKEALDVDDATLTLLAEAGDGSMRDALSIMDQAIASAPIAPAAPGESAGRPHLEIHQVRELMGSVSNAVYEQVLEAVHANNSADVLSIVGRLLDAGNGAPQLARQFVRYLRNAIVAKVTHLSPDAEATGIAADLLQISPEERNRAARSAALFTEEDLSRFLAITLRTFDELGYRQEQRFHLELGLLKLVHVQRLVPIEDLLSQLGAKPASRPNTTPSTTLGAPSSATASSSPKVGGTATAPIAASTSRPTPPPSPFESDRTRKVPTASLSTQPDPVRPESTATAGSMALAPAPATEAQPGPQLVVPSIAAVAANPSPAADLDLESLQSALVSALAAVKGQQSASEQMEESTLKINGNTLEIHTTLSKTMLPVVLNADAERTIKGVLRDHANSLILKLISGAPTATAGPKKPRQAASGSVAEMAEKHPMVQEARRLFSAEISNVIDLREKE
jgi:DNA polymerase-3 subunit gamma/tau